MEKTAMEMLECAGYVNRRYLHQQTGQTVNLAVIVGPPGPTAVHTPEICFSSRAYEQQQPRRRIELAAQAPAKHSFWTLDFETTNVLAERLRVYYAWSLGERWEAAASPRYQFAAAPQLYKLQLAANIPAQVGGPEADAGREFLEELIKSDWRLAQ
jgi:hypothetical protein